MQLSSALNNPEALKQMQLSSVLNNPEALKNLQYNPLLYYTYYAQVHFLFKYVFSFPFISSKIQLIYFFYFLSRTKKLSRLSEFNLF